jgi:hypothetical protein
MQSKSVTNKGEARLKAASSCFRVLLSAFAAPGLAFMPAPY